MLKKYIILSISSLIIIVISVVIHEVLQIYFGKNDVVFFFIAVFLAPLTLFIAIIGSIVIYSKSRKKR